MNDLSYPWATTHEESHPSEDYDDWRNWFEDQKCKLPDGPGQDIDELGELALGELYSIMCRAVDSARINDSMGIIGSVSGPGSKVTMKATF